MLTIRVATKLVVFLAAALILIVVFLVTGYGIYIAWNVAIPPVFHGPEITYKQTLALWFLASMTLGLLRGSVRK